MMISERTRSLFRKVFQDAATYAMAVVILLPLLLIVKITLDISGRWIGVPNEPKVRVIFVTPEDSSKKGGIKTQQPPNRLNGVSPIPIWLEPVPHPVPNPALGPPSLHGRRFQRGQIDPRTGFTSTGGVERKN